MKSAALHSREGDRLASLAACGMRDDVFLDHELTRIAKRVSESLDVPIALVSVVQESRQVFAGRVGLEAAETHRDVAFCAHVVVDESPLIVNDALEDDRFADNPLVTGPPHIRFYAGAPVYTPDGLPMGTVCAIDKRPRAFSEEELATLREFAERTEAVLRERFR